MKKKYEVPQISVEELSGNVILAESEQLIIKPGGGGKFPAKQETFGRWEDDNDDEDY